MAILASTVDFGFDLYGVTDLDPSMLEGGGLRILGEALARRLITPRGGLLDDPDYGFDVTAFLNDDLSAAEIARIAASIDAEFAKDERVIVSTTTLAYLRGALTISTIVTAASGNFRLLLAVGATSVTILSVG